MSTFQLGEHQVRRLLCESARLRALLVLSWRNKAGWRVGKARLLRADPPSQRLAIENPTSNEGQTLTLLPAALNVGVSLRSGHKKFVFASSVMASEPTGLQLAWPEEVQQMQRRCYQRVEWPPEQPLKVTFWEGSAAGQPQEAKVPGWTASLLDISAGGMRVVKLASDPFPVRLGAVVACRFAPEANRSPLLLDALCRHFEPLSDGRTAAGFQFVGLECTEQGRAKLRHLARVVARLQREHIHRKATDLLYRMRHQ